MTTVVPSLQLILSRLRVQVSPPEMGKYSKRLAADILQFAYRYSAQIAKVWVSGTPCAGNAQESVLFQSVNGLLAPAPRVFSLCAFPIWALWFPKSARTAKHAALQ